MMYHIHGRTLRCKVQYALTLWYLLSDSGIELVNEELVEVILLMEGAGPPIRLMYSLCMAVVGATQAEGSIGRTGSCRGTVKYPLVGLGSQHLATTRVIGLKWHKT